MGHHPYSRERRSRGTKREPLREVVSASITLGVLAFLLVNPRPGLAANPMLAVSKVTGMPSSPADLTLSFTSGTIPVSTVLLDLSLPASLAFESATMGPAAAGAGKTVQSNPLPGGVRVLIFGLNQTPIATGVLATLRLNISASSVLGNLAVGITKPSAASADAVSVVVSVSAGCVTVVDKTPPVLSDILSSGVTNTQAVISWTSSEAADSQVEYGTSVSYGKSTSLNSSKVTSHLQTLNNLTANTSYHYRVKSRDAAGNQALSADYTFATLATDPAPPVISGVKATGISSKAATVSWLTNEVSDSQVEYGASDAYGSVTNLSTARVSSHSQTLNGLSSSATYHYRVKSRDPAGNLAVSTDYTFTTLVEDLAPPVISGVQVSAVTSKGATVSWTTNESSDSQIQYGTTVSYGKTTALNTTRTTSHSQTLSGLSANTSYHFSVKSRDPAGNLGVSGDYTLTTTPLDTTPPVISAVQTSAITTKAATVSWTTDEPSDSQVDYGTTTSYGKSTTLNSAKVTSHSQTLSGLSAKTTYHFTVKSRDAAGNRAVSADFTFVTPAASDTTPPVISAIKSSCSSGTSAVISWTTDEAADSQVEYGKSASYGLTKLVSSLTTLHSMEIGGLTANTRYYYRVKSRDAAGNLAVSGNLTFTTTPSTDKTPPIISGVRDFGVSDSGARLVWTTDEASDSQVEYGVSSQYGTLSELNAGLSSAHSQVIKGLQAGTTYHYRVRSRDAAGNPAISEDHTLQTSGGPDTKPVVRSLHYPRARFAPDAPSANSNDEYTGVALVNLDPVPAQLTFTAFSREGELITASDILNPAVFTLMPGRQFPVLDTDLFGPGLQNQESGGWITVGSSTQHVAGFFLMFNSSLSVLDGANIPMPAKSIVLPEATARGLSRLELLNPNTVQADVVLQLMSADGIPRSSAQSTIAAAGNLHYELFNDIFNDVSPSDSDYIRVISNQEILALQVLGNDTDYIEVMAGLDGTRGATTLYSPQYVAGGIWNSWLSVVNLDSKPGSVTLRFIGDDGTQLGPERELPIEALGKVYISDPAFFDAMQANTGGVTQGYLVISGGDLRLAGSVSFGDTGRARFCAGLPLVATLSKSMLFEHIASDTTYYTGLALLNPGEYEATVRIEVYSSEGNPDLSTDLVLGPHERRVGLLTEFLPWLVGQSRLSGYIRVLSEQNIASFALFGSTDLSNLASIPAQQ